VYNALQTVQSDIVLIHDGARPFVTREIIENCIQSVKDYGSGICALPCSDTVAVCKDGKIVTVPDRKQLYALQTPQGFFTENLKTAYREAVSDNDAVFTDDASVFAKYCGKPHISKGARTNIKITYLEDVKKAVVRCGFGIDTHAFGKEQDYIVLAGVKIPSQSGLVAHSDGDVLVHALMDALLSAAGLKDIGHYFPDTDDKWKNADSMKMLKSVLELIRGQKLCVQNVSIAIQAEKPRLAKYIDEMKFTLANALRIDVARVGITAGTNEGLGYVGEGKGITVNAYVLLNEIG
jgi:2-C-methyl-D-erythritol 4-phosphate cytidylyltransferase/2-C-methyl-D-erythritol 2,4-cyclodiphosphate synthase